MIETACPRCSRSFELADVLRGQFIKCPDCGTAMRVEDPVPDYEPIILEADEPEQRIQDEPPEEPPQETTLRVGVNPKRLSAKRLRKRKKRRGPAESYLIEQWNYYTGTFGVSGFILLGLLAFWLFLLMLTPFVPQVSVGMITLGSLLYMVGWWWVVFVAYRDDGLSGTLCLMTMFYVYVYIYMNLEGTWRPASLLFLGILMTVAGYATGFFFGAIKF